MGWWKVQGTQDLVGDDAFSLLRSATWEIAQLYEREFGRLPTRREWQLLVHDALEPERDLRSTVSKSLFAEDGRPHSVQIELEGSR
jgi:hypothetical protein